MNDAVPIAVAINGVNCRIEVEPNLTLLDLLRDQFGLHGVKLACDQGACGACTVLVDDAPVTSCLTLAFMADGKSVATIESLATADGELGSVQQALFDAAAPQCGFCTAGMVMLTEAMMRAEPSPSPETVETWLSANICRCSGYQVFRRAALSGPA